MILVLGGTWGLLEGIREVLGEVIGLLFKERACGLFLQVEGPFCGYNAITILKYIKHEVYGKNISWFLKGHTLSTPGWPHPYNKSPTI